MRLVLLATTALAALSPALAEERQVAAAEVNLGSETVVVTATRTAKALKDVPATVTVITDEEIADALTDDVKALIRFEPGVSVRTQPSRFSAALSSTGRDGNSGFNIRGLEGNRVLVQVDGVRIPDSYSFGAQSVGRGDYVDLDLLKSVEIVRGPASALYGSDGLAGAVSFMTKDPDDFLEDGRDWYGQLHAGYASADEGLAEGFVGAARSGRFSAMLAFTHRDAEGQKTPGTNDAENADRTKANPEDNVSDALLAKIVFAPNEDHRFRFTIDALRQDISWDVLSARSKPPLGSTSVLRLVARDEIRRDRFTLDHDYKGEGFIRSARTSLFYQAATTRQLSWEDRNTAADRERDSTFDNAVWGFGTQLESRFDTGAVRHRLTWGADLSSTSQTSLRDGVVPPAGETFPTRPFPDTDYLIAGVFAQDEIALLDGALTIYPALRLDYYRLDPRKTDPLYHGPAPVDSSDTHLSPKLGLVWKIDDSFAVFLNLAEGFKAPAPGQVNTNFANPIQNYASLSNPDLAPETSRTVEGGVRYGDGSWSVSVAGFWGEYDDFISQVQVGGSYTPADPAIFQYVNLPGVEIYGIEAKIQGDLGDGFGIVASASYAYGTSETSGIREPLQSIDPVKLTAGLTYRDPDGLFGGQLALVHSAAKDADRTTCPTTCFLPDAFTAIDLTAWVQLGNAVKLRAGIFNLTDETYWWWSDIRGLAATSTVTEAYAQPGRNAAVSITFAF